MDSNTEYLGLAQKRAHEAAQFVSDATAHLVRDSAWGRQRMEYLAMSLVHLNQAYAMIRAAVNEAEGVRPAVQPFLLMHVDPAKTDRGET